MKTMRLMLAYLMILGTAVMAHAAGGEAFTDPDKAGPDFAVQGEYVGGSDSEKWGTQVIALGDGKFDVVGFKGGLPGDGWKRGDILKKGKGELKDNVVTIKGADWAGTIKDNVLTVTKENGEKIAELKKVDRKSPTLGAKAPSGAVVLFDGSSAENFIKGKLVEGNLLGATGCESKQKFNDHSFHIEFRTPFMPKSFGQARGNSGVYIQSRYECQVLDSFGLDGKNNECGGIYSQVEPAVNMCFPPLSWQTYDVDFTAARYDDAGKKNKNAIITIRHNGVLIYDQLEIKQDTPGCHKEANTPDGIFLQDHGNPVAFRNIWVVEKK